MRSHSLRHTFATQLLNAGASLEVVKELMGIPMLQMTLRYTQLYDRTNARSTTTPWRRSSNNAAYTGGNPWTTSAGPPSTGFERTWSAGGNSRRIPSRITP